MAHQRETSIDERKFILRLFKGKSYSEIVGRSPTCVQKIIIKFKNDRLIENKWKRGKRYSEW